MGGVGGRGVVVYVVGGRVRVKGKAGYASIMGIGCWGVAGDVEGWSVAGGHRRFVPAPDIPGAVRENALRSASSLDGIVSVKSCRARVFRVGDELDGQLQRGSTQGRRDPVYVERGAWTRQKVFAAQLKNQ